MTTAKAHLVVVFWSGVLTFIVGGLIALIGWLVGSWGGELAGSALMMVGSLAFAGALLEGEEKRMTNPTLPEKQFPLQFSYHDQKKMRGQQVHCSIPWSVASKAYPAYCDAGGRGQTLERLAERGGFSHGEMDMFYPEWRKDVDEIPLLKAEIARISAALLDPSEEVLCAMLQFWHARVSSHIQLQDVRDSLRAAGVKITGHE